MTFEHALKSGLAARGFVARRLAVALLAVVGLGSLGFAPAWAQAPLQPQPPVAPGAPAAASSEPKAVAPPASAASAPQRVEIQGGRIRDTDERRQSTAAKIVIGREEIERYGDSNTSEVLKRLPGVTVGGAPGRGGGAPRMRGLGAGFTQILLNGERLPPGFSVDFITPEQIDRIEVLRSPTAETGARAIAGTINIITREGFKKRINDVKLGFQVEQGRVSPGVSWTRNDSLGDALIYTTSITLFRRNNETQSRSSTVAETVATGAPLTQYDTLNDTVSHGQGFNANARLQWRLGEGHSLVLMPMAILSDNDSRFTSVRTTTVGLPEYATAQGSTDGRFTMLRLNTQYNQALSDGTRLDLRLNGGVHRWTSLGLRDEFDAAGARLRDTSNAVTWRDNNILATGKATKLVGGEHNWVAGMELESNQRREQRVSLENGLPNPLVLDFGDDVQAKTRRTAAFVQDEWNINPQWAAHAGLRWEGIQTNGVGVGGAAIRNRSSVATPLLHAVYKLDPKSRDQVRASLTRSYRTPTLAQLIARPNLSSNNSLTSPDRYGNPNLKPELATGIDTAFERYLDDGGVLSVNLFHRRIQNVIRNVITVNSVTGRTESRPQNISNATTSGIELEAKFRLDQVFSDAPRVDLRWNASVFDSKVDAVPGPNNRLEAQARGTLNLGADYRFRGTPLSIGGNVNWTPSVETRLSEFQTTRESAKLVGDAFALWTFNPNLMLRVSVSNFAPRDFETGNQVVSSTVSQTTANRDRTVLNLRVGLEIKL
jgi:outer membrane receptor for ferrienterochelin and colicins